MRKILTALLSLVLPALIIIALLLAADQPDRSHPAPLLHDDRQELAAR